MSLLKFTEPALVIDSEDTVSKLASSMLKERKYEAVVTSRGDFRGIVFPRDVVRSRINDPNQAKVGAFSRKVKTVSPDSPLDSFMNLVMIGDYRSVPVEGEEGFHVLTKLGMLRMLPRRVFRGRLASDVMNVPYCISDGDSLGVARSVLRNLGVGRLVLVDGSGGFSGLIDGLDMLKSLVERSRSRLGERVGEKLGLDTIPVKSLAGENFITAKPDVKIPSLVKSMIERKLHTVIVREGERLAGIITSGDIIKLTGEEVAGALINVSGMQDEDVFIRKVVDEELSNHVRKLGKLVSISHLSLHVDKHHETGRRVKYSVRGRLVTGSGSFFARDHGWDVTKATRGVLKNMERMLIKKKQKAKLYRI